MGDTRMTVAIVAPAFVYMPLWAAASEGLFRDEGLDVTIEVAGGTTHGVTERLLDGRAQIGIGTPEGVLLDGSGDLVIIAGHANRAALSLVAQPRFRNVGELRGARFGVASLTEGTAYILREMLAQRGLHDGDYALLEVGTHPVRWEALKAGTLDAALQLVPFNYMAEDAGFAILAQAYDDVPDYAFTTVNVRRSWAGAQPAIVEAFLRALLRGTAWIYDHPAASVRVAASASGVPEAYVERAVREFVDRRVVARDLSLSRAGLAKVEETLAHAGATRAADADRAIDLRALERARASLAQLSRSTS
ncbi:ABC transporter substrate-binding protein [Vulcanimicrobium alpinum]|nr:ABC transporter substrate-binding protein [Vulcanimicrobium alpinum]